MSKYNYTISIRDWLNTGFRVFEKHFILLLFSALVLFGASFIIAILAQISLFIPILGVIAVPLLIVVLMAPLKAGISKLYIEIISSQPDNPQVTDMLKGFEFWKQAAILGILVILTHVIILLPGLLALAVPLLGIVLVVISSGLCFIINMYISLSLFLIVDQNQSAIQAIRSSIHIVHSQFWKYLFLTMIVGLISFSGVLACGVGLIVTIPLGGVITGVVYVEISRQLYPNKSEVGATEKTIS